ncbi:hypothetical protein LTR78_010884 [Recurvomyces mirabilis]|uniref:Uncharacterized protein n=1 Tax=Recurvomyces mirabilis TaxID=574656 RepID=A0AAE0TM90_9PEZI|nr:hypothetical protein LTR78_010884 [Recurvomyces mirabilis]KAK5150042.1 hypothetical protein LTS14_010407 [Recurvomyces mirabilis]
MKLACNLEEEHSPRLMHILLADEKWSSCLEETVALQSLHQKEAGPVEIDQGYAVHIQEAKEVPQQVEYFSFGQQAQAVVPASYNQSERMGQQPTTYNVFEANFPKEIQIPPQLSPPRTYSFYETPFGRRLHRACLEAGYQLLLDPMRRPHTYDRVFRLSLISQDRAQLIAAFQATLERGKHEVLSSLSAPLIHVGGAGTHYPYRDQFGNLQARRDSYNVCFVGPQTLAVLDNLGRDSLSADMTVEIAGFEGECFDPYDVEGYLEEKAISIDATLSFAAVEIMEHTPTPESMSTSPRPMSQTPRGEVRYSTEHRIAPFNLEQLKVVEHALADPNQWNDFSKMTFSGVSYPDAATSPWTDLVGSAHLGKQH